MRILILLGVCWPLLGVSVTVTGYDGHRTNANNSETILNRTTVAKVGQQCSFAVDGAVYSQPLIAQSIGGHDLLITATMHGTIYAFDAYHCSSLIWQSHLADSFVFTPGPNYGEFPNGEIGCLSSPVIDMSLGVVYLDCLDSSNVHKMYSVRLVDGSAYHSAITVTATANAVSFVSSQQKNRSGSFISGNNVYITFASFGEDVPPYNGWIIGYNKTTLAQTQVWCNTCGGLGAGIWMSGGAPALDASGNIYVITGNGDWDGTALFGESFVRLNVSLTEADFFTPTNWATLNAGDTDLGSARALLIDDSHVFGMGKDGRGWIINTANMGGLQSNGIGPAQLWSTAENSRNDYAFGQNQLFLGRAPVKSYAWSGSTLNTTPLSSSTTSSLGEAMAYSSDGTAATGILWLTTCSSSAFSSLVGGTLRALNADTMVELWNSGGIYGSISKFGVPTVANGYIYVPTFSNAVILFGLPSASLNGGTLTGGATLQ